MRREGDAVFSLRCLVLCVAAILPSSARLHAERPAFQTYSSGNGLASDMISALHVDERGYLWIGTGDGLSRFDGERFVTFGPESGLPSARVLGLEVVKGRLFVATDKGLAWLDESRSGQRPFLPLQATDGISGDLDVLYGDRQGRLWAGGDGGLVVFDGTASEQGRRIDLPPGETARVLSIVQDLRGTLWVGTPQGLLRLVPGRPPERRHVEEAHGRDWINALAVDDSGRLWVGHELTLYVLSPPPPGDPLPEGALGARALPGLDRDGRATYPSAPGDVRRYGVTGRPLRLIRSAAGRTLVATTEVVTEFGPAKADVVLSVRGALDDTVLALETDREGNAWIGTEGHGLLRLRRDGVTRFGIEDDIPDRRIRSLVALPGGPLVALCSQPDFLSVRRHEAFRKVHLKTPPAGYKGWGWGQVVLRDRSGEWWLGTGTGLLRFGSAPSPEALDGEAPKRVYTTADGLGGNDVFRIFEDHGGDIWVGTFGERAMARWDSRTGTMETIREPGVPNSTPTAFAEDHAGNLWIALYNVGLVRRRRGSWQAFPAGNAAPEGFVHALLTTRDGVLWIGAGRDGLWRVEDPDADHPVLSRYRGREPLPSQNIRALVEDDAAHLWIGSTRGIAHLDPGSGRVRSYGPLQGLPNEIVTCAARDQDGRLWFGTLDGLVRIAPRADPPLRLPVALLTSVAVDGVPRFLSPLGRSKLPDQELPAASRRLTVEFVAPSLAAETAPRFVTRLVGAEKAFGPASDVPRADFTGLAPGRYRFEVRAIRGSAAGPVASFGLLVPPPFWRRLWVLACLGLLIAALATAAHRVRVAHLVALEKVRAGFATDLHDDLGAGLSR